VACAAARAGLCATSGAAVPVLLEHAVVKAQEHARLGLEQRKRGDAALVAAPVHH
jgi:hypothetical protein